MKITKINTKSSYEKLASYSRAIVIGDLIFISNTAGINYETGELKEGAIEQAEQALSNVRATLAAADSSLADVVRTRIYIPNPSDLQPILTFLGECFKGIDPTTTITASPLAGNYRFEIEVTAHKGIGAKEVEYLTI